MGVWRRHFLPPLRAVLQPLRRRTRRGARKEFFTDAWPVEKVGPLTIWDHHAVRLPNARIDFDRAHLPATADAPPCSRMQLETGFLQVAEPPGFLPPLPLHLDPWVRSLSAFGKGSPSHHGQIALAVCRYEEQNLFHAMSELYNSWLLLHFLDVDPATTEILLIDDRTDSPMDAWFGRLFKRVDHARDLHGLHAYDTLLLGVPGYGSPLYPWHQPVDAGVDAFRRHVLECFGIPDRTSSSIDRITLIQRPRTDGDGRPRDRHLANEEEVIQTLERIYPESEVRCVDFGGLSFEQQLREAVATDLLIGMHGAGLTHAMFLPSGASLLELFPRDFSPSNDHYRNIALWRGLPYARWQNLWPWHEHADGSTTLPQAVLRRKLHALRPLSG